MSSRLPAISMILTSQIPEEEKNLGPHDRLIHVYHFTKETAQNQMVNTSLSYVNSESQIFHLYPTISIWQQIQNFGEPFFLVIHEGETLQEIKVRIQRKLQVPDEEFAKVYIPWVCVSCST